MGNTFRMPGFYCIVFLLIVLGKSSAHIDIEKQNSKFKELSEQFTKLLYTACKKYISASKVIYVVVPNSSDMDGIIDEAIRNISNYWTLITNDSCNCDPLDIWVLSYDTKERIMYSPDMYIIFIDYRKDFRCFINQLKLLEREEKFNHRAIFIVVEVISDRFDKNKERNNTVRIFQQMWSMNLFAGNFIVLSKFDSSITVVTARPYSMENPCGKIGDNGLKYTHFTKTDNEHSNVELTQPPQGSKYLEGCVFTAGTAPFSPYVVGKKSIINNETDYEFIGGIDIELVRLYSMKKKFKYQFYKTHTFELNAWFEILENGTFIGILQDTLFHNIDIAFGGLIPSYVSYNRYDYSPSYKFSAVSFYVTDANVIPQWKVFFGTFPLEVWVVLITSFLIVLLLYNLMGQWEFRGLELTRENNFSGMLPAELLNMLLGFSSSLDPKSSYLRVLFCSWALYGMHWYIAYTTVLYTLLTNPPYEKEITTMEELVSSGLKVKTAPLYIEYFVHIEQDKTTKLIFDQIILSPSVESSLTDLVKYRNSSVMEKEENVEWQVNMEVAKIHKLEDKMVSFSVSAFTDRGSILSHELNQFVLICFQAGLLIKWERDVMLYYNNRTEIDPNSKEDTSPLRTRDLKGAFILLIFGLIVSFLCLIGEVIYYLIRK